MPRFNLGDEVVYNNRVAFFGEVTGVTRRRYGPDAGKIFLTLENPAGQFMLADQDHVVSAAEFVTGADFLILITHCTIQEASHV
jgi:hypothetical protein